MAIPHPNHRRPRLLMSAFACHPTQSMESRLGWRRAMLAAEGADVTVLCGPGAERDFLIASAEQSLGCEGTIDFQPIQHDWLSAKLIKSGLTFYAGYRRWQARAHRVATQLHQRQPFDLTHQVSFCGYREPGQLWKLGVPFVWGPVGGTQGFPLAFLGMTTFKAGSWEVLRNALNWWQLRFSRRVRKAAQVAEVRLAASRAGQEHLHRALGVEFDRQLETGLDCPIAPPRERRDTTQPLRLLWAGRLRAWKGFPLLLAALAKLPADTQVRVRVLGDGAQREVWRRRACKLGVDHLIEWTPWCSYAQTLPHYRWADAFAFTSLRDTSGTGLIESLAAGAPIIGLDHQGAADIMTPRCAAPIAVSAPEPTAQAFADAIAQLAKDPDRLLELSRGAQRRAQDYDWAARCELTAAMYAKALAAASVAGESSPIKPPSEPSALRPAPALTLSSPERIAAAEPALSGSSVVTSQ